MSRVQLALNVDDLDRSIAFYSTLLNTQPAKRKPGYANFAIEDPPLKLVLVENASQGGTINHLGVEVDTSEQVHGEIARLTEAGLFTEEQMATTCCFATQDKVWATGPNSEKWEVYTVLDDAETFGTPPDFATTDTAAEHRCCSADTETTEGTCCRSDAEPETVTSGTSCCS